MVSALDYREDQMLSPSSRDLGLLGLFRFKQQSSYSYSNDRPLILLSLLPHEKTPGFNCSPQVSRRKVGPPQGKVVRSRSGGITLTQDTFIRGRSTEGSAIPMSLAWHFSDTYLGLWGKFLLDQADCSCGFPSTPIKKVRWLALC